MVSRLEALERVLAEKAPVILASLRPGLPSPELEEITLRHGFHLPSEVAALYAWHDGASLVGDSDRAELFPGAQMLPLTDALTRRFDGIAADRLHDPTGWKSD